ncbi:hypothetical protein [Aquimarina longa]|uniref:hypothetical protein n=1 Tax=Aquimarina longa TaxID=1080221 RepID=UPI00078238A2|nr:hypothetical protein [Aquimarina longa]
MKKTIKLVSILLVCTFIGCKGEMNDELLKKEFTSILSWYYFNYPKIKNNEDVKRFSKYLEVNYQDLNIIKEQNYVLYLDSIHKVLHIETKNDFWKSKAAISLIEKLGVLDQCAGDMVIKGFCSKELKKGDYSFLKKIHEAISKVSDNTLGVPGYNKKGPFTTQSKVLLLYEYGKLSVYCIKNDVPNEVVNQIMQFLDDFLASKKPLPFDFAFIPIEIK